MVEQGRFFINRSHAGLELGKLLETEYRDQNVLVIGIPRGGVEVAFHVANTLNGELSTIITKKLPYPAHPELTMGAVAEDGSVYFTALANDVEEDVRRQIINNQLLEIHSRVQKYRHGKPLPHMQDRIVILIDDGIETGATLVPALKLCKSKDPAKIIVAAPVSGDNYVSDISSLADKIHVLEQRDDFFAVGQVYEDFPDLSDEDVINMLEEFESQGT